MSWWFILALRERGFAFCKLTFLVGLGFFAVFAVFGIYVFISVFVLFFVYSFIMMVLVGVVFCLVICMIWTISGCQLGRQA